MDPNFLLNEGAIPMPSQLTLSIALADSDLVEKKAGCM